MLTDPKVIDGRDMEPPEPLELAIAELAALPPGEELVMLLRCEPLPLYAMLERNGYRHRSERLADGTTEVHIQKD
ncbi:MAG: sulfurtransferase TusA family protein [Burkholderiales bacterium]|nr:sulfurtransferase TusA family protein [Burkholderiales bacterium]